MTPLFFIASLLTNLSDALPDWEASVAAYQSQQAEHQVADTPDQDVDETTGQESGDNESRPVESAIPAQEDASVEAETDSEAIPVEEELEEPAVIETRPDRSRDQELTRLNQVLSQLDTLQARFVQINTDGSEDSGELYLDRPGRIRFDYDEPSPILLVADGSTVAIADTALETVDRAPIGQTPFKWLLDDTLDLETSEAVEEVGRYDNQLYLTLVDPEGGTDGRLTFIFEDVDPDQPVSAVALKGWYVVDSFGAFTEVRLSDLATGQRFDPRLFILDDDSASDRRRTRR